MGRITLADIHSKDPDLILPPDSEFAGEYSSRVSDGKAAASTKTVSFVAICRNAMPWLPFTLSRIEKLGSYFADWQCFVYENDSVDGTKEFLATLGDRFTVASRDNGRPHLNYTKAADRTIALAEYRNACRGWVADNRPDSDYTVVFDTDPWGGFSINGVMNTIGHLGQDAYRSAAGMCSYSWCVWGQPMWPHPTVCQYDGWACRFNYWEDRPNIWFHLWHPPVGSPPVKVNSCFGQLAVYRTKNYLQGVYRGGDCEHVSHWRTCGGDCYLNPSQRAVSFWVPDEENDRDGVHGDVHEDVARRDSDEDHR